MEYVDGSDLENVLANQGSLPLVLSEKKDILHQLLEATAHIHKSGVTHRDIKPANIMLATRSPIHIVLVDFGLSTGQGQFNTTCGTPLYSAAELLIKNTHATNKVDMYAVGVIALQLMYGFRFSRIENRDFRSCLAAIREQRQFMGTLWPPSRLPHPFSFIHRLLSYEPADRPSALKCLEEPYFQTSLSEEVQVMEYHEQPITPYKGVQTHSSLLSTSNIRPANMASQYFGDPGRSASHQGSPILGRRQTPTSSLLPPPKRLRMEQSLSRHDNPMTTVSAERQFFFMGSEEYKSPYPPPPLATKDRHAPTSIQLPSIFGSKSSHRSTDQISPHTGVLTSHDSTVHNTGSARTSHPGAAAGGSNTEQVAAASKMSIQSISSPTASGGYSESGSQADMLTNQCWYDPMHSMGGGSLMQLVGGNRGQAPTGGQVEPQGSNPENSFLIQSMSYSFLHGEPTAASQPDPGHNVVSQPAVGPTNGHSAVQPFSDDVPHHEAPHYEAPNYEKPHSATPHGTTLHNRTPYHGTPHQETPHYGTPQLSAPHHGTLHQGTSHQGTPYYGTPHHEAPHHEPTPDEAHRNEPPIPQKTDGANLRASVEQGQANQPIIDAVAAHEESESTPLSPTADVRSRRSSTTTMKRRKATS